MIPGKVLFKELEGYLKDKLIHPTYRQNFSDNIKFILTSAENTQTYLN